MKYNVKYKDNASLKIYDLKPFFNRNVKLLPCQRLRAIDLRHEGYTYREIAKMMGVKSHRTIIFIVNPKTLEINKEKRKIRHESDPEKYQISKDKRNEYMRKHRKHKKDLLKDLDIPIKARRQITKNNPK